MQAADFIKYVNNPQLLDKQSVKQLQKLVADFPYFQSAHVLLSMASKKWDASVYQQSLKKTAIVVTNRAHLFNLIHRLENETYELSIENDPGEKKAEHVVADTYKEDSKQELDILKAAEISTGPAIPNVEEKAEEKIAEQKPALDAEQILEREIGKEVITAFVEKEILKTTKINHPKVKTEEPESFGDWLAFLKKNNGQPYQKIEEQVNQEKLKNEPVKRNEEDPSEQVKNDLQFRKQKNKAIIDKIIESSPGLIKQKEEQKFYTPDIKAKESLLENEHLVTETLARIYALQGNVNKAVRAYEILSLKFPQKSAYFASLIQKLKHNQ
jgi:hypothetical protein